MEPLIRVEMLGRFGVRQGDREISRFRTQKTGSLLACMALHRARPYSRESLIEMFWQDSDLKAARTNLSVALNALRRQLEPPGVPAGTILLADHAQVHLNPAAFTTDVEEFESALREAESEKDATRRLTLWLTATDLYRGDLLPGYYEDWVLAERNRLQDAYRTVLRNTVGGCSASDQPERGIEYARRLVQADPLDEEAHSALIRLLMALGRSHDALRQYQELERVLQTELQATPSAALRELIAPLRHILPAASESRTVSASDNRKQETVAHAPPRTPEPQRSQLRLPIQFTRFFGREQEIVRLTEMLNPLSPSSSRLVTLTGPGGTGKTRLSIEVAGKIRDAFPGDIWFIPLAELDDPRRLGEALRDALELPRQTTSALDQVIAFLNGLEESSLLILDNFEQIATGGAPIVWTLLSRVPRLRCLVTSRRPLSLAGEREIPLLPLPIPGDTRPMTPDVLVAYPSVALFVDRAQTARPEFQVTLRNAGEIATICEKLEGIPLAIELAAARARALTPSQMLERLTERFELLASRRADKSERHRSLWAAIDWSYHLLSSELRQVFARLSVFRGGWTLEAAEAVGGGGPWSHPEGTRRGPWGEGEGTGSGQGDPSNAPPTDHGGYPLGGTTDHDSTILDALGQLRGHSLIRTQESSDKLRFDMLESLREFAQEQLPPEEGLELERRHAAYFHQWVSDAHLFGPERMTWFTRFEEDFDNLRAVLAWSLRDGNDVGIGLHTAGRMGSFWWLRGHISEGRRWFDRLLERADDTPTEALARSLQIAGVLAYMQGDFTAARSRLEHCIKISRLSGQASVEETAYEALGNVAYREGDYAQAEAHYENARAIAIENGLHRSLASVLGNLANVAQSSGDFEKSRALNLESLEKWREGGERNGEARTLHNLANLAQSQGQYAEARDFYEQSMTLHRELADKLGFSTALRGIAEIALGQQDFATAITHARESLALTREMNARTNLVELLRLLSDIAWNMGEWEAAARTQGTLDKVRQDMNYPVPPVDQEEYEQNRTTVRNVLGVTAYDAARTEGRKLSLEQALTFLEEMLVGKAL